MKTSYNSAMFLNIIFLLSEGEWSKKSTMKLNIYIYNYIYIYIHGTLHQWWFPEKVCFPQHYISNQTESPRHHHQSSGRGSPNPEVWTRGESWRMDGPSMGKMTDRWIDFWSHSNSNQKVNKNKAEFYLKAKKKTTEHRKFLVWYSSTSCFTARRILQTPIWSYQQMSAHWSR